MKNISFEYKALNLMDQIETIEITLDYAHRTIHIFDLNGITYPMYSVKNGEYVCSDEFLSLAKCVKEKYLAKTFFEFVQQSFNWVIYSRKNRVLVQEKNQKVIVKIDTDYHSFVNDTYELRRK
jgi:hypothetical protein